MISDSSGNKKSVIYRIDPRFRVVSAVFYCFIVASCYEFQALFMAAFLSVIFFSLSGVNFLKMARRLLVVNLFISLFWIILPLTIPGRILFNIGPINIYQAGIVLAAKITIKSNTILFALVAFIATMPLTTLGDSLIRLRVPEKLVYLLLLTYRYIFVIEQEYKKIIQSIKIRGFKAKSTLHTYKTFAYIIGMLFVRAAERADRVYNAMRCRGFNGRFYSLAEFPASPANWLFSGAMAAAMIFLVTVELLFK